MATNEQLTELQEWLAELTEAFLALEEQDVVVSKDDPGERGRLDIAKAKLHARLYGPGGART